MVINLNSLYPAWLRFDVFYFILINRFAPLLFSQDDHLDKRIAFKITRGFKRVPVRLRYSNTLINKHRVLNLIALVQERKGLNILDLQIHSWIEDVKALLGNMRIKERKPSFYMIP